ncbi:hypothetical protein JZU48_00410, partial [bacterium]|nr:hypothetical protein [bacterium]
MLRIAQQRGGGGYYHYYYASCSLSHPLSQLATRAGRGRRTTMTTREEEGVVPPLPLPRWELCVGDVVAVHCDESTPPEKSGGSWIPYRVPWSHCQVLSIYREVSGDEGGDGGGGNGTATSRGDDGAATAEKSASSSTVPASSVR